MLYKSLLACYDHNASTLNFSHCSTADKSKTLAAAAVVGGAVDAATSVIGSPPCNQQQQLCFTSKKPVIFNSLAVQVCHCDSYRNISWNSASFSATLDSTLAKLTYKVINSSRSAQKLIDRQKVNYSGNNQFIAITYQRQSINCNNCN